MKRVQVSRAMRATSVNRTLSNRTVGIKLSKGQSKAIVSGKAAKKAK